MAGDLTIANTATIHSTVDRLNTTEQSLVGRIFVAGNASLDGILTVNFSEVFRPRHEEVFEIIAYSSHDGMFSDFQFEALVNQMAFLSQSDLSVSAMVFDTV